MSVSVWVYGTDLTLYIDSHQGKYAVPVPASAYKKAEGDEESVYGSSAGQEAAFGKCYELNSHFDMQAQICTDVEIET
jgi:hypothetical protein